MTTQPIPLPVPLPLDSRRATTSEGAHIERVGPEACTDDELLAIVLGGGATSRRTARRLIERFGTLANAIRAHPAELRIAGLPPTVAPRLPAAAEVGRRLAHAWPAEPWVIRTPADVAEPLIDSMGALEREELRVMLLDAKNVVIGERTVYRGNLAGSSVRVGEVYRDAVRACAAAVIVAHNHPSGDPSPSAEDVRITAELAEAGRLLDIDMLDHLVIGRGRWSSLRAIGALGQSPPTTR